MLWSCVGIVLLVTVTHSSTPINNEWVLENVPGAMLGSGATANVFPAMLNSFPVAAKVFKFPYLKDSLDEFTVFKTIRKLPADTVSFHYAATYGAITSGSSRTCDYDNPDFSTVRFSPIYEDSPSVILGLVLEDCGDTFFNMMFLEERSVLSPIEIVRAFIHTLDGLLLLHSIGLCHMDLRTTY